MSSLSEFPGSREPIGGLLSLTSRLVLRPLVESDRAEFVRMEECSREHLAPWEPTPRAIYSDQDWFARWLARSDEARQAGLGVSLAAIGRPEGPHRDRLIGLFSINNIVRGVYQNADAGWRVSAEFIGQGYATEGVRGLLGLAFDVLKLHRVQAAIQPGNAASLRVAHKCGFQVEGRTRAMLHIAGAWQDHLNLGLLAEDHRNSHFQPPPV